MKRGRNRGGFPPAIVLTTLLMLMLPGCNSGGGTAASTRGPSVVPESAISPETPAPPAPSSPSPNLGAMFSPLRGFAFEPLPADSQRAIERTLLRTFGGLRPEVIVRRVVTSQGTQVPVRVAAISFELPEGATIEQFASEFGREFLGSNPRNATPMLGGNGVYVRDPREMSESVAFFLSDDVLVYAFGATIDAPTEIVSRSLFQVACSRINCEA